MEQKFFPLDYRSKSYFTFFSFVGIVITGIQGVLLESDSLWKCGQ